MGGVVHWEYLRLVNQVRPFQAIHAFPAIPAGFMGVEFYGVVGHNDFTRSSERGGFKPFGISVERLICVSCDDSRGFGRAVRDFRQAPPLDRDPWGMPAVIMRV